MEKHQIIRPRRLAGTPYLKFSHKASGLICLASVIIGLAYNYWRSERAVYIIKSGYYNDDDYSRHLMKMSLLPVVSFKKKNEMTAAMEDLNAVDAITGLPKDLSEASIDL